MSMRRFSKIAVAVFGVGMLFVWTAGGRAQSPEVPLSITSKSMVAKHMDRLVIFEGNVVLTKGEFTLTADRLEVTLAPADPAEDTAGKQEAPFFEVSRGKDAVSQIEAIGNVKIIQGDRHGKSERAIYDQKEEKVILTGQPEVWEKDYRVSGKKMVFFLRERKNVVEEGTATVYPKPGENLASPAKAQ